jgi:hypothetical protein
MPKDLRWRLRARGIRPQIPKRVWKSRKPRGRPVKKDVPRYQAERTCAWFQRKYRPPGCPLGTAGRLLQCVSCHGHGSYLGSQLNSGISS